MQPPGPSQASDVFRGRASFSLTCLGTNASAAAFHSLMRGRLSDGGLSGAQPEPLSPARAGGSAVLGGVRGSACRPRRTDALAGVGDGGPPPLVTTAPSQAGEWVTAKSLRSWPL